MNAVILTCNHDGCHAETVCTDPRHLDNLGESWRCPRHLSWLPAVTHEEIR